MIEIDNADCLMVDQCPCSGRAALTDLANFHGAQRKHAPWMRVACPDCPRSTGWHSTGVEAVRQWHKMGTVA